MIMIMMTMMVMVMIMMVMMYVITMIIIKVDQFKSFGFREARWCTGGFYDHVSISFMEIESTPKHKYKGNYVSVSIMRN